MGQQKETIYFGGPILTMEEPLYAEAVLVRGERIAAVGSLNEIAAVAGADAQRADLEGAALLPAFLDPHSHLTALAQTVGRVSLAGAKSFDEIAQRLRAYRQENRIGTNEWIIGFGYDHNDLKEKCHPNRRVLDEACPDQPVLIAHASGHMGVAGSKALEAFEITDHTPDPVGGKIGRSANGEPDGYLEEAAFIGNSQKIPRPSEETLCEQLDRAQQIYLKNGIVTVQDGLTRRTEYRMLSLMAQRGRLKVDVVAYADEKLCPELAEQGTAARQYRNHLRVGGYKIILDGSPQGRTAWMSEPYEEAPDGYRGYPAMEDGEVTALLEKAVEEDVQVLAHCNGDAACGQMIRCYREALRRTGKKSAIRPVMIHAQTVRPDQLREMKELGILPSFFAAHSYYWGDVHLKNLGAKRGGAISPAGTAERLGLNYTFHQDTPVLPPDMIDTLWCAVNRVTKEGVELDSSERLTTLEALRAVTRNAAYQYFEEEKKGSIRVGKRADLVVLSEDPLTVPPEGLRRVSVCRTVGGGEVLYQA